MGRKQIHEDPDKANINNREFNWYTDAAAFIASSSDIIFVGLNDHTHFNLQARIGHTFHAIKHIKDPTKAAEHAYKILNTKGYRFIGNKSELTIDFLYELTHSNKSGRELGIINGRFWPSSKTTIKGIEPERELSAISIWESDKTAIKHLPTMIKMLQGVGESQENIQNYLLDINPYALSREIKDLRISIGDVIKYKLSSKSSANKDKSKTHVEPDPFKRKAMMGSNDLYKFRDILPKNILRMVQRNPDLLKKIKWKEKFGVDPTEIPGMIRQLNEDPDSPQGKYLGITDDNIYCFVILSDDLFVVQEGGFHGDILRLFTYCKDNSLTTSQDIIKAGKDLPFNGGYSRKRMKPIKFYGNESKLNLEWLLNNVSKLKDSIETFIKRDYNMSSGGRTPLERSYGIAGRCWFSPKRGEPVISFWKPAVLVKQNINSVIQMLQLIGVSGEAISEMKLDFKGHTDLSIGQLLQSKLSFDKKEKVDVSKAHIEVDPVKRKLLQKRLGLPSSKQITNKSDLIPGMVKKAVKQDASAIDRIDWSKFGISKQDAIELLTEDADRLKIDGKVLGVSSKDSITFGYTHGILLYKEGANSNHQQIYYELKNILAPNYPKLETAIKTKNVDKVNHFIKQIIDYLSNRGIIVKGDYSNIPELLQDVYKNGFEMNRKDLASMRDSAYRVRKEVFEVSGRAWRESKIVSFWNSGKDYKKCLTIFKLITDIVDYRFEFLDDVGHFYTYSELKSSGVKKGEHGDMAKAHTETDPYKRKLAQTKAGISNPTDYSKFGGLAPWQRERDRGLAEAELAEGNTFPNELYHITSHINASKIVKEDTLKFTFATGYDSKINKDKFFYLSMSYDKWGRYAGSDNRELRSRVGFTNTILVFDSKALQQVGKLINVNYWEPAEYKNDEKEVRFISNKQTLTPASKYIKEIHVLVPNKKSSYSDDIRQQSIRSLLTLENSDLPVYFYSDPGAFKLTLKSKSFSKVSDALDRGLRVKRSEKHVKHGAWNNVDHIIHLLVGTEPKVDRYKTVERLRDMIRRTYGSKNYMYTDAVNSIEADLHNAKSSHDPSYQKLANIMLRLKLKSVSDIIDYVYNKFEKKQNVAESRLIDRHKLDGLFDNKDGIGAVPYNQDVNYMGFITYMTTKKFRELVPPGVWDLNTKEYVIQAIKDGQKLGTPFLEVRWDEKNKVWQTVGHEGRSRMDAIGEIFGTDVLVPVHMFPGPSMRARHITDEMKRATILPQRRNN